MSIRKKMRTFYAKHRYVNRRKYDYESNQCKVIVSLALVPERLPTFKSSIMCLLRQSHRPDRIEVHIAKTNFHGEPNHWVLPAWLQRLKAVKIIWEEVDIGPARKFISSVVRNYAQNPLIIVVDDDMVYNRHLIKRYLEAHKRLDHAAVLGARGWRIHNSLEWGRSPLVSACKGEPQRVGVITGVGTYCLRPQFFDLEALQDFSVIQDKDAVMMDDIWLSGHLSRQNIPKYVLHFPKRPYKTFSCYGSAITDDNTERKRCNDIMLAHFKQDWKEAELMTVQEPAVVA